MLSRDFEIFYYSDTNLPTVNNHYHDYYELYFFIDGQIIMNIEGEEIIPPPGTLIIIPPQIKHYVNMIDGTVPYRRFIFWITQNFIDALSNISVDYNYLTSIISNNYYLHKFTDIEFNTIQGKVFSLIDEIHSNRFGKDTKILLLVSDFILTINRLVYEIHNPLCTEHSNDTLYQSIIQYIETHIDENLSLEIISKKLHISKFHISHIFTNTNGTTLHKYIIKKRLAMCKDAILNGHDISSVAEIYGFSDYSVFYRAFVKEFGKSPKKYRDDIIRNTI